MDKKIALTGRVAVVTGGSRGIGRAIAELFGRAGARVVIASSQAEAVEHAAAELSAQGIPCIGVPCNVAELNQVQGLLRQALNKWGQVDIWVNNAGIAGPFGYTLDVPPAEWGRVIQTNLMGTYYGCVTVLPHMMERRYGKIINMSGGGAHKAQRYLSAYSTSKAAIMRLTDGLARDYKDHHYLSINLLEPGIVPTDMTTQFEDRVVSAREALKALPRVMQIFGTTAEEAANVALRMASRETD
nr:SDR family oxidoreductase [Chloroflexaceae bacterium]